MIHAVRRVLAAQGLITLVAVALSAYFGGASAASSALLGGVTAALNSLLMGRRVRQAGLAAAASGGKRGAVTLYVGLLERIAVAAAGFTVGIVGLNLPPLPMVATFFAAQFGILAAAAERPSAH
jgi:ATP synthase protein I